MNYLSTEKILEQITQQKKIKCTHESKAFSIEIDEYSPFVSFSIHNGNQMRKELQHKCNLSAQERIYEEDPYTKEFIEKSPIRFIVHDSRYEYDLNRDLDNCIYDIAWETKVWNQDLTDTEKQYSITKYNTFYRIVKELLSVLSSKHSQIQVLDVHTYNYSRYDNHDTYPTFDLNLCGTNRSKYKKIINFWHDQLLNTQIIGHITTTTFNHVFNLEGQLSKFINTHSANCFILAIEFKKIYCEEKTGIIKPEIFNPLKKSFNQYIINSNKFFQEKYDNSN